MFSKRNSKYGGTNLLPAGFTFLTQHEHHLHEKLYNIIIDVSLQANAIHN